MKSTIKKKIDPLDAARQEGELCILYVDMIGQFVNTLS